MLARSLLLPVGLAFLLACSESPTEPELGPVTAGRFVAVASGSVTGSFAGTARIVTVGSGMTIELIAEGLPYEVLFATAANLPAGRHDVTTLLGGGSVDAVFSASPAQADFYLGVSGQLVVTGSSADAIEADFDFQALGEPAGTRKQVRLRGRLHATRE